MFDDPPPPTVRPFDGSEPDVDPATGDERETTGPDGRPL